MEWTGTVTNGVLEGSAVHKPGAGETKYWFKGEMRTPGDETKATEHPKK